MKKLNPLHKAPEVVLQRRKQAEEEAIHTEAGCKASAKGFKANPATALKLKTEHVHLEQVRSPGKVLIMPQLVGLNVQDLYTRES